MASISLPAAQKLCTASEFRIVKAARRPQIQSLDLAEVKKLIVEARRLRDKWRDLATQQRRKTQQDRGARTTDQHARSRQKVDVFADALARLQAQAKRLASSAESKTADSKAADSHEKVAPAPSRPAKKSPAKEEAAKEKTAVVAQKRGPRPIEASERTGSKFRLTATAGLTESGSQSAKLAAKQARVAESGLTTRTRGHISAQGRRAQSRRDSKG
jgi:hypothetical protein